MPKYIHGYSPSEQQRLIDQAAYWRDALILPDLPFKASEHILDIGCGVGAVLAEIHRAHPGVVLSGLDLSAEQITKARAYFASIDAEANFQVGDSSALPYPDCCFDHIYMMWFLEHVQDPLAALREARRVLKPGGSITINETDYHTLKIHPESISCRTLLQAFIAVFEESGKSDVGSHVARWLDMCGFQGVSGIEQTWFKDSTNYLGGDDQLICHIEYFLGFIEPAMADMIGAGYSRIDLENGIADMRAVSRNRRGSLSLKLWRVRGFVRLINDQFVR